MTERQFQSIRALLLVHLFFQGVIIGLLIKAVVV